jgi:hypothetical protein
MNQSSPSDQNAFPPELVAKLGIIPDAVLADLAKALTLNGRIFAMLDADELEVFNFFRKHGRKYGVTATVISAADPADLAKCSSQEDKDETMRLVNSTVCVTVI